MQEIRERERLQKMGRSSLQTDSVMHSRKKRSLSLPRLTTRRSSSAGERQEAAESAEEAARVQKAAAWQWYTRGVGEAVLPTKRPAVPVAKSPPFPAPIHDTRSKAADDAIPNNSNVLIKPALPESPRTASRFKAEALFARRPPNAGTLQPTPSALSAAPNSTPLYDEFELSGLRNQMADFVQRLQVHGLPSPAQKSKPLHVPVHGRPLPAAASVSTDHQHTKARGPLPAAPAISSDDHQLTKPTPPAAAAISSDHQLTKPPSSAALVASTLIPFHRKPFSALHRLFRKVIPSAIFIKSTKNSPQMTPPVYEPEVLPDDEEENTQHHFHHYIHHHHHHYHYGESSEESATITPSRRRHSESSSIRPQIPSLLEGAESDEEEEEAERSAIEAYLSSRRRHSDSSMGYLNPRKAAFDEEEEMKVQESAMSASQLQVQRRYNSERFTPNKIPTMIREELPEPATDKCDEEFPDIRSRRRHSAENEREEAFLERKAEGGGKSGGGTYKLGGGGKSGGGTYKRGGGDAGRAATAAINPLVRRRHSEGLQRPEGVHYASPGRAYWQWHSPSARDLEDVLQRQIGASGPANAAAAARPPRPPPIYTQ